MRVLHSAITALSYWLRRPTQRRQNALGLALLGVCAAGSQAGADAQGDAQRFHITLDADDVEYSDDNTTATLSGNVRLRATGLPEPTREVDITTDRMTVALGPGDVQTAPTATVTTPQFTLTGDNLTYNVRTNAVHADQARAAIRLPLDDRELTVYATSRRLDGRGGDVQLRHAQVSTCDREKPHYALRVKRVLASPATNRLVVHGASLRLYGLDVPLVSQLSTGLLPGPESASAFHLPGYSSLDGLYVPFRRDFSGPEERVRAHLLARLNTRHLVSGSLFATHSRPTWQAWAALARHEEIRDDLTRRLAHDALPEVGWEAAHSAGDSTFSARLMAGNYRDEDVRSGWKVNDLATTLRLDWLALHESSDRRRSAWVGTGLRGSLYGNGDSYRTLDLRAGGTAPLGKRATGQVEVRHHFVGGRSPFEFDDVDIRTEGYLTLDTALSRTWGMEANGRYDLERGTLRDYTIDLRRKVHCLTWHLTYRFVGASIGFGVELSDLRRPSRLDPRRRPDGPRPAVPLGLLEAQKATSPRSIEPAAGSAQPRVSIPSEYDRAVGLRPRAPDAADTLRRRPPPSLRLASPGDLR